MLEQWKRKRDMIGGVQVVQESLSLSPVLRVYMRCDPWAGRNVSHSSNLYMFLVNGTESDSLKRSIYLIGCGAVVCRRKLLSTLKKKPQLLFLFDQNGPWLCVCVCACSLLRTHFSGIYLGGPILSSLPAPVPILIIFSPFGSQHETPFCLRLKCLPPGERTIYHVKRRGQGSRIAREA